MTLKNRQAIGIAIFALIDILQTWYILRNGVGIEVNPLYGYIGLVGLSILKAVMAGAFIFIGYKAPEKKNLMGICCGLMCIPVLWNFTIIF